MKRYLPIILALLFAVPAYGQSQRIRDLTPITAAEITDDTTVLFGTDRTSGSTPYKLSLAELRKKTDVRAVANVAAFASVTADEGQIFITRGYSSAGIGSGIYRYHATGRPTADGVLYFNAAGADDYLELLHNGVIDVTQAGAIPGGAECSSEIQAAITSMAAINGEVHVPAGTYTIDTTITIDGSPSFSGAGVGDTVFETSGAITAFAINPTATSGSLRPKIGGFTVDCGGVATIGLDVGNSSGTATRPTTFRDIRVLEATTYGIRMRSGIGNLFERVIAEDGPGTSVGFFIDNENNVTTCTWIQCSFRQNHTGMDINAGSRLTFISCIVESNRATGLKLDRRATNGFSNSSFIGCWLENNGYDPPDVAGPYTVSAVNTSLNRLTVSGSSFSVNQRVRFETDGTAPAGLTDDRSYWVVFVSGTDIQVSDSRGGTAIDITDAGSGTHTVTLISQETASVYSDMLSTSVAGKPQNITFQQCVITGGEPAFDVMVDRGTDILFDTCSFTDYGDGGFSPVKLGRSSLTDIFVELKNCNAVGERATPTLYQDFPSLGNSNSGFAYEFRHERRKYANYSDSVVTAGDGDTTPSVWGIDVLIFDNTSSETITDLDDGYNGKQVECHVDGSTTLDDSGGNFKFDSSIGGTFNGGSGGKVITLRLIDGVWTQTGYNVDF